MSKVNRSLISAIFISTICLAQTNYSLSFDGVDDVAEVPYASSPLTNLNTLTLEAWVNLSSLESGQHILDQWGSLGIYTLRVENNGTPTMSLNLDGMSTGGYIEYSIPTSDINQWVHVTATYNGSNIILYRNGVQMSTAPATGNPSTTHDANYLKIGNNYTDQALGGMIDEVRIWNIARTQSEIQNNMYNSLSGSEIGLVGYWSFNEGSGATVADLSGNGNNGTISGATWSTDVPSPTSTNYSATFANGSYVEIPASNDFSNLDDFSISIWIKLDSTAVMDNLSNDDATHFIINKDHYPTYTNSTWNLSYYKDTDTGNDYLHWRLDIDGSGNIDGLSLKTDLVNVLDNKWHYISITRDASSGEQKFYIDGEVIDSGNAGAGTIISPEKMVLSRHVFLSCCGLYGELDDFSFWNIVLTSSQIQNLMYTSPIGTEESLIGYWNFNEGNGTILTDQTSNGNDGTLSNITWTTDVPSPQENDQDNDQGNYSLSFDGVDDYAKITSLSSDINNSSATLMGWFKSTSNSEVTTGYEGIMGFRNYPSSNGNFFALLNWTGFDEPQIEIYGGTAANIILTPDDETWYHLAITYDGDSTKSYLNGTIMNSAHTQYAPIVPSIDLLIGNNVVNGDNFFKGFIDDISVWNESLSASQIQAYMFAPPSINLPNLESYYNFNAGSGNILFDQSGNGNHGNIHGATWSDDGAPTHPTAFALISVDSVEAINSSSVSVPINIDLMGESMSSVEIRFSGFQDQIAFLDVDTVGTLLGAASWNIQVNEQEDLLITGSYGSTEISENGILFRLKFEIPAQTDIDFIPVDITSAEIDEIDGEISYLNGGIDILDILWGDVSQNNDVSLYDAALVLKYLVGTESFNDIQLSIADVTQDSSISALDATVIAQYAVEIIDSLPAGDEQNLNAGGAFVINEDEFIPGSILEIPIVLSNGRNLLSFEMDIAYEPEMISFENITWSEMIGHFTIEENIENGSINIAGMGTTPDGQDGVFGTINLFVSSRFNEESIELTMNRYRINESEPAEEIVFNFTNSALSTDLDVTPKTYSLHQNYPNPFNPITTIKYDLPTLSLVNVSIYNLMGQKIKSLIQSKQTAGYRTVQWDATNDFGEPVSAGMYIYIIEAGEFRQTKKMVLLK